jgi:DnaK suppressor protein
MSDYAEIKTLLEEKLRELTTRVEEIDDDLSKPGNDDWEERATEAEDDEVLSTVGNLSLQEISQIREALKQIEAGTYGKCSRCGRAIPKGRLEVLPFATKCAQCA